MNRRIVDITVKSKEKKIFQSISKAPVVLRTEQKQVFQEKKPREPLSRRKIVILSACAALILAVFGIHLFFAKVRLAVIPESREVVIERDIVAAKKGIAAQGQVEAVLLRKEQEGSRLFSATGSLEKQGQASGVITVYNTRQGAVQALLANTRFVSQDGKLFRSVAKAVVPGATASGPGQLDVQVKAAEAGESYNIGPSSFSLPGLAGSALYTAVYGKSTAPMTGGSKTQVVVVSQDDINRAKDSLLAELREGIKRELQKQLQSGFEIPEDAYVVEVSQASSLAKAGVELNQFNVTGKVRIAALAFSRPALDTILKESLGKELASEEVLLDRTLVAGYEFKNVDHQKGTMLLHGFSKGKAYTRIQEEQIKQAIRGRQMAAVRQAAEAEPGVQEAQVSPWPFWEWKVPQEISRITVSLNLDSL